MRILHETQGRIRAGDAGTSGGAQYPCPRQVGMGRVTGTGADGLGRTHDSITYVGDSEPVYIWNITGTAGVGITGFGPNGCTESRQRQ